MRCFLCLTLCALSFGQGQGNGGGPKSWSDLLSEGKALRNSGDYAAATNALRQALALAEHSSISQDTLVELHYVLAGAYADAGQNTDAEGEYRRSLALVGNAEGSASVKYAVILASMTMLPTQIGDPGESIRQLRNALSTFAQNGRSNPSVTFIAGCLGVLLTQQKRYREAEPLLANALADLEIEKAPDPQLLASYLSNLAVLRLDQGRMEDSLDLQRQSIQVLESALGREHPSLVRPLNNLATAYVKAGFYDQANVTYHHAIDICRKTLGANQFDYAVLLRNQAVGLKKLGQKRQAKKMEAEGLNMERAAGRQDGVGQVVGLRQLPSKSAAR